MIRHLLPIFMIFHGRVYLHLTHFNISQIYITRNKIKTQLKTLIRIAKEKIKRIIQYFIVKSDNL